MDKMSELNFKKLCDVHTVQQIIYRVSEMDLNTISKMSSKC